MPSGIYANLNKEASTDRACLGTAITYTVTIQNINTHPLTEITFVDTIPPGFYFQQGSVLINGEERPSYDPGEGFPLLPINPMMSVEVEFSVEASFIPTDNPTTNIAHINFRTIEEGTGPIDNATEPSNPVSVTIVDCECDEGACEIEVCKIYSISLPFTVKPFARKETPDIVCFGQMTLSNGHTPCPDPRQEFDYTLTQRIRVELPVAFGAEVCYEEPCAEDDGECDV